MAFFLMQNTEEDILNNVCNQTALVTIDVHFMDKKYGDISQNVAQLFMIHRRKKVMQVWNGRFWRFLSIRFELYIYFIIILYI